ncbi:MAG: putative motility protein [Pirellulaceae bacterium]
MDCASCTSSVGQAQQSAYQMQISVSVLKKQLDATRQMGESVAELLDGAVQLSKEAGKGTGLDAQA